MNESSPNAAAGRLATMTTPSITAEQAIQALVRSGGDVYLATERLGLDKGDVHVLSAIIAADAQAGPALHNQLRTLTLLRTFQTFQLASSAVEAAISDMDGKDLGKFIMGLTQLIDRLTDSPLPTQTQNINVTEYVMSMLPPEARQAVLTLLPSTAPGSTASEPIDTYPGRPHQVSEEDNAA